MARAFSGLPADADFDTPADNEEMRFSGYTAAARALYGFLVEAKLLSAVQLRLLYIGACSFETMDRARWLNTLSSFLGHSCELEVTAVGKDLDRTVWAPRTAHAHLLQGLKPVLRRSFHGPLQELPIRRPGLYRDAVRGRYDFVILHHPGFVTLGPQWVDDPALTALARVRELRIVGSSFDATDYAWDKLGMAVVGRQLVNATWNPAYHQKGFEADSDGDRTRWGAILWRAGPRLSENLVDAARAQWRRGAHAVHAMSLIAPDERPLAYTFGEVQRDGGSISLGGDAHIVASSGSIVVRGTTVGRVSATRTLKNLMRRSYWARFDVLVDIVRSSWPAYRAHHNSLAPRYRGVSVLPYRELPWA